LQGICETKTKTDKCLPQQEYDNKLQLCNHGTLPVGITLDQLSKSHSSFPHNPILAGACFLGGYIDSWGSGIMKIVNSCKAAGLPTPTLEEDMGGFMVKLFKDRLSKEQLEKLGLNDRQIKAVEYIKTKGKITNSEYQEINEIGKSVTIDELRDLVEQQIFVRVGKTGRGTYYELANKNDR
jgi:ATP-dependent DNA helicase RecG